MIVYTDDGITYQVVWAQRPFVIDHGDQPATRLVGVRFAGDILQVGVLEPPHGIVWASPEAYLADADAAEWRSRGFARLK